MEEIVGGGIIKHLENLILLHEGEPVISAAQDINFKPFTVKLDCNNPIDDKEIKRISEIIIKYLHKSR